jgi:hypothetical protein
VSGRTEQLGKQLRRLRTSAAIEDAEACETALRRATHLARDLIHEHTESEELDAAVAELVGKHMLDAALGQRIAGCIEAVDEEKPADAAAPTLDELLGDGAVLDRFLRSIEHGALMPELPFEAHENAGGIAESATSKSAVTVSGRQVILAERGREGLVFIDDKPASKPFPLLAAPRSKPEVKHESNGLTRIIWEAENLSVELAADFRSATIIAADV